MFYVDLFCFQEKKFMKNFNDGSLLNSHQEISSCVVVSGCSCFLALLPFVLVFFERIPYEINFSFFSILRRRIFNSFLRVGILLRGFSFSVRFSSDSFRKLNAHKLNYKCGGKSMGLEYTWFSSD